MKLTSKFTLVVAISAVMIASIMTATQFTSRRLLSAKNYQYVQATAQSDVSNLINYLTQLDYWGVANSTASRDLQQKINDLDSSFKSLTTDSIISFFPDELQTDLNQISTLWNTLLTRLEPVKKACAEMESIKLPMGHQTNVQSSGIRKAYEAYPEEPLLISLLAQVEIIDTELKGILRTQETLSRLNTKSAKTIAQTIENQERTNLFFSIITTALTCILLTTLILTVSMRVVGRILKIQKVSSVLAEKDFTAEIKPEGSDEMHSLMTNINNMVCQLNDFFIVVKTTASKAISSGYEITDSANSTAVASSQIDKNVDSVTYEFEKINESVKSSMSLIEEMNSYVETLVSNNEVQSEAIIDSNNALNNVAETLENITNMAEERSKNAGEMHQFIEDGDQKITATAKLLDEISKQIVEVKEMVSVIKNVAQQTNLLSMNAAIESAHAGEAGKGFSVVAEEIRSLAEETSKNSKRIDKSVAAIIASIQNAGKISAQASEAFSKVSTRSDSVVNSLHEISNEIVKIDTQMQTVRSKSADTTTAANQITQYCATLTEKQNNVSNEVFTMSELFERAQKSIREIKSETSAIVQKMTEVSKSGKESYKNMSDLENILEEFKTKETVNDAEQKAVEENQIEMNAEDLLNAFLEQSEEERLNTESTEELNLEIPE